MMKATTLNLRTPAEFDVHHLNHASVPAGLMRFNCKVPDGTIKGHWFAVTHNGHMCSYEIERVADRANPPYVYAYLRSMVNLKSTEKLKLSAS